MKDNRSIYAAGNIAEKLNLSAFNASIVLMNLNIQIIVHKKLIND